MSRLQCIPRGIHFHFSSHIIHKTPQMILIWNLSEHFILSPSKEKRFKECTSPTRNASVTVAFFFHGGRVRVSLNLKFVSTYTHTRSCIVFPFRFVPISESACCITDGSTNVAMIEGGKTYSGIPRVLYPPFLCVKQFLNFDHLPPFVRARPHLPRKPFLLFAL